MKHVYTKIVGKVYSSANPMEKALHVMTAIMQGFMAPPENDEDYYMENADFGFCFIPENNDYEHCVQITYREDLDKYITNNNEIDSYFEQFFGKIKNPNPGFIDNWNDKMYNDKKINEDELAGKSGKIKIELEFTNKKSKSVDINGKNKTIYTPITTATVVTLPVDKFKDVTINEGTMLSEGNNNIVTFAAFPGLKESLDINDKDLDINLNISFCKYKCCF